MRDITMIYDCSLRIIDSTLKALKSTNGAYIYIVNSGKWKNMKDIKRNMKRKRRKSLATKNWEFSLSWNSIEFRVV